MISKSGGVFEEAKSLANELYSMFPPKSVEETAIITDCRQSSKA